MSAKPWRCWLLALRNCAAALAQAKEAGHADVVIDCT